MNFAIFGAGCWGTAVAYLLSAKASQVLLYSNNQKIVDSINLNNISPSFPNSVLDPKIKATNNFDAILGIKYIFLVLPVQVTEEVLREFLQHGVHDKLFIICSKGIDCKNLLLVSELVKKIFPNSIIAVLSGPNFANEVMCGNYSAATLASEDLVSALEIGNFLCSPRFKVTLSDDVVAVQVVAALKNVLAILCGVIKAKNYGNNTCAAILTMGMRDVAKIVLAKGGKVETLWDYCGIGDLMLTCYSTTSRNMKLGMDYVSTGTINTKYLAEGFHTLESVMHFAQACGVKNIPVFQAIYDIFYKGYNIDEVFLRLFSLVES